MGELLLELLSEEIPARMQRRAIDDLTNLIRDKLAAADIPAASLTGYVTPRRLVVIADGIPARQPDRTTERRGPRVGAPQPAIDGFLRGAGLTSIAQCEVQSTDRGEFYIARVHHLGVPTGFVLLELLRAGIAELPWSKSMRYPASNLRWVRPLNSVICLFDGEVLDLPLDEVPVGRVTRGHRFLSAAEISVVNAADYRGKLAKAHVVLDWSERRQSIEIQLNEKADGERLTFKDDPGLLDEVAGLVEYPVVLIGSIDADFVRPLPKGLPPEVLATAMRTHQKYFSCLNADCTPAPRFLFVANNETADNGAAIVAGNERVLRARLSDAKFFWDQDRKDSLESRVEGLKQRVYHAGLFPVGDMFEKARRMEGLARFLALRVPDANSEWAARAAKLAKADLSTGVVGEFPELQGIMGRYYALNDGENLRVAEAITDHYKPLGPNDACPAGPEGIVVAIADKTDALVSFFATDDRPTGSGDPYALRRAALGLIRLILETKLRLPLTPVLTEAARQLFPDFDEPPRRGTTLLEAARHAWQQRLSSTPNEVLNFITDRLRVYLRERGFRHDQISAVFARFGAGIEDDLVRIRDCLGALRGFLASNNGVNLLSAYRRASNIVGIEEARDDSTYADPVDVSLLKQPEEDELYNRLNGLTAALMIDFEQNAFDRAMGRLATLRHPVDEFFEHVTVNTDEKVVIDGEERSLRKNRLRLLSGIRDTMNHVADFSQIEG
jgi:glycyl-tRNA synthetase beta chain